MGKTQPSFQHEVFGSFCLSGCLFRRSGDLPQRCCGPSRDTRGCSCQSCSPWTTWTCPARWLCWISLCCLPLCRWIPTWSLLPTLTELLSLLISQLSMLPRLLTLLPVVSSTQSEFTVMPTDMLDLLPTPTVLLSQLSPMR